MRILLAHSENWSNSIKYFTGELNAHETKTIKLLIDKKDYSKNTLYFVVGGSVKNNSGNENITFKLFRFDPKTELELNADTVGNLTIEQVTEQVTEHVTEHVTINLLSGNKNIDCYGDSLTHGAPVYGERAYPYQLSLLVGGEYTVSNQGIGGNTVQEILARQGAYPAIVDPLVIPSERTPVDIVLKSSQNGRLIRWANSNLASKVNPVYVNGIEGTLAETTDSDDVCHYTFTRSNSGEEVTIKRPTFLITSKSLNTKENIQILWIGQNGNWNSEDELVEMFKSAINHMGGLNKRYICVGLSSKTESERKTLERKMGIAFGEHYINIREYLTKYGLEDANITPTPQDNEDISQGKVPTSLRADEVHFTADGYKVIANVIYRRGKELGYWN